ncbi:hypothetical protein BASA81_017558 [Batrachochytrium salamandrivorans]|nr:hypothetical protein BASA81_017558 [Batrachochytrium salamandrivorans]
MEKDAPTSFCYGLRREATFANLWYTGDYAPNKLNYVLAFGTGRFRCSSRSTSFQLSAQPWRWLAWRVVVCAYLTGVLAYSFATDWTEEGDWFYYLTHWQTLMFAMYGVISLATCLALRRGYPQVLYADTLDQSNQQLLTQSNQVYRLPWYVRLTWVLHDLSMSCGIWVAMLFWLAGFTTRDTSSSTIWLNLIEHLSTCVLVMIDFYFAAFPWPLLQCVWGIVFVTIYTIWTGVHYAFGLGNKFDQGTYIYKAIDWAKPVPTFFQVLALIFIALPLVNLIVWWAYSERPCACWARSPKRWIPWIAPVESPSKVAAVDSKEEEDVEAQ